MAKITIIGRTAVVVSGMKLEDVKLLEKYDPYALVLSELDRDGVFQDVFVVGAGIGSGTIGKFGVSFGSATNAEGFALVTIQIPDEVDPEEYVTDKFGIALLNLNEIEESVEDAIAGVALKKEQIARNITVA